MRRHPLFALLLAVAPAAYAAQAAPAASPGSMLQVVLGLVAVVALMGGTAWLLKRAGVSGAGANNVAKVIGGVSVGNRERVMVIEVADQWIVVGVAQGRVSALATMPRQERPASGQPPLPNNFAGWLKQTIDKRNGK